MSNPNTIPHTAAAAATSMNSNNSNNNNTIIQDEEGLRRQLQVAMKSLKKREPLEPTYKRYLMNGVVSQKRPLLPKDKFYKRIGSDIRYRVETFVQQTHGKDPLDRISQRQPIDEEQMRNAFTLRDAKKHEQKALLNVTIAALPRRYGMDSITRRQHLEAIAMGLQSTEISKFGVNDISHPTGVTQQIADAKAREELRQRQRNDGSIIRKGQKGDDDDDMKRKGRPITPQHALHKIYYPIFKKLWDMEFQHLGGINPFRIIIDRENCASCGAPDYFDVIDTPMNLSYIQRKVDDMEYTSLQSFFQDIELMISNALLYNSDQTNPYRIAAEEMKKRYRRIYKKVVQTLQSKQLAARKASDK